MSNLLLCDRPVSALNLLERDFSDLFGGLWNTNYASTFVPNVEVTESEKEYHLVLEAPGLKKDDISIEVEKGVLKLSGEKKAEKHEKERKYYFSERSYGSFERTFRLPEHVDAEHIQAAYKDGVLELSIPKTKEAERKAIQVKVE